jgi:hypothetical protein
MIDLTAAVINQNIDLAHENAELRETLAGKNRIIADLIDERVAAKHQWVCDDRPEEPTPWLRFDVKDLDDFVPPKTWRDHAEEFKQIADEMPVNDDWLQWALSDPAPNPLDAMPAPKTWDFYKQQAEAAERDERWQDYLFDVYNFSSIECNDDQSGVVLNVCALPELMA